MENPDANPDAKEEHPVSAWLSGRECRRQFVPKLAFTMFAICLIVRRGMQISKVAPPEIGDGITFLVALFALVASLALIPQVVRRLHDIGLSGWWVLLCVIVQNVVRFSGVEALLYVWVVVELGLWSYICLIPGDKEANKYGPSVKALDFTWIKRMALVMAVPVVAELAALAWLNSHPSPIPAPQPAAAQP